MDFLESWMMREGVPERLYGAGRVHFRAGAPLPAAKVKIRKISDFCGARNCMGNSSKIGISTKYI